MIGALIALLISVIIIGVLWWAFQKLLPLIPLDEPFRTIVYVISVLIMVVVVIWVVLQLLGMMGVNVPAFR